MIKSALFFGLTCLLVSCGMTTQAQHMDVSNDDTVSTIQQQDTTLRIGSFNIQNFGKTKMSKPAIVDTLVSVCLTYDLIAIQEISHKNGDTPQRFLDSLNVHYSGGIGMSISERSGLQADDVASQEQYGFYYKKDKIKQLDSGTLYPDSTNDYFQREPYMAHFQAVHGNFDFVVITVHTAPAKSENPTITLDEIKALEYVIAWAQNHYPEESDFIVLGDFNADCSYVDEQELAQTRVGILYTWLIPDSEKTNLAAGSDCTYDRIFISSACVPNYTGRWQVDRSFQSKAVSDHWPVWAEFRAYGDEH